MIWIFIAREGPNRTPTEVGIYGSGLTAALVVAIFSVIDVLWLVHAISVARRDFRDDLPEDLGEANRRLEIALDVMGLRRRRRYKRQIME